MPAGGESECGVEVHRTLFLGELAMCEPHDATSFLVPRPPGNSLLARHTRLVGSVQACCGSDDFGQWLILGDMTGAVAVKLTLALQRIAVGVMMEAIGDLASGSGGCPLDLPEGHPHRVHVRVRHALIHGEESYLERRWRTMRQQRCLEQEALHVTSPVGEVASTLRQINPPPSTHKTSVPAPAQHTVAVEGRAVCQDPAEERRHLHASILENLAGASGNGMLYVDLLAAVAQSLQSRVNGQADELACALAELEESFLIYRNGDRYLKL